MPILEKTKTTYKIWISIHRNLSRAERFGIGSKIDFLFLELLELLRRSIYTPTNEKVKILEEAILKVDSMRFFVQLLWKMHLMPNNKYLLLAAEIENLGKMVGGWKKSLILKTSATEAEERKE